METLDINAWRERRNETRTAFNRVSFEALYLIQGMDVSDDLKSHFEDARRSHVTFINGINGLGHHFDEEALQSLSSFVERVRSYIQKDMTRPALNYQI